MKKSLIFCVLRQFLIAAVPAVLVLSGCGGGGSDDDGETAEACNAYRVINGSECTSDDLPTVLLEIVARGRNGVCTGTVISNDDVITAAHCLASGPINSIQVVHGRRAQQATAYAVNPRFSSGSGQNNAFDLALVKVPGFASGAAVTPAVIGGSTNVSRGDLLAFIGYGKDNSGEFGLDLPNENPRAAYVRVEDVSAGIIFNVFEGTRSNPCFGDSGGAAIKNGKIVGIESGGTTQSCREGDINLFAAVKNRENLDFLRSFAPTAVIE